MPKVYKDVAGYPTIGYGHVLTKSELQSGKIYIRGMLFQYSNGISQSIAESILDQDLEEYEFAVNTYVKVPLKQNQYDSLVSFCFNVGAGAFMRSTLVKRLNAGDYDAVPEQLRRWKYSGGQIVQGLINRREKEVELWNKA